MTSISRATLTATFAALALGATVIGSATPAAAWGFHPHHWHGGWHHGYGIGYVSGHGGDCYITRRPAYDHWGRFRGARLVRVCD